HPPVDRFAEETGVEILNDRHDRRAGLRQVVRKNLALLRGRAVRDVNQEPPPILREGWGHADPRLVALAENERLLFGTRLDRASIDARAFAAIPGIEQRLVVGRQRESVVTRARELLGPVSPLRHVVVAELDFVFSTRADAVDQKTAVVRDFEKADRLRAVVAQR